MRFTSEQRNAFRIALAQDGLRIKGYRTIGDTTVIVAIEDASIREEVEKGLRINRPRQPTISDMVINFSRAVFGFVKSGCKVVSEDEFKRRLEICRSCDLWDETARRGMGKCKHFKCGCTKVKHWMEISKCPLGKWSA